ncbi:MAG: hypothetical protein WBQ75_22135 [Acetobacteraceae bacterium]
MKSIALLGASLLLFSTGAALAASAARQAQRRNAAKDRHSGANTQTTSR